MQCGFGHWVENIATDMLVLNGYLYLMGDITLRMF